MLSPNSCSSADIPRQILMNELPALADLDLFITHIYDVTKAHLLAMTHPGAPNNRFLLCSGTLSFPQYATILKNEFSQYGYNCTCFVAPKPIIWLTSFWDKQAANILPSLGKKYYIDGKNVKDILGINVVNDVTCIISIYSSISISIYFLNYFNYFNYFIFYLAIIRDMSLAAIANGLIPDRSRDGVLTSSYVRPELDLTGVPTAEEIAQQLQG